MNSLRYALISASMLAFCAASAAQAGVVTITVPEPGKVSELPGGLRINGDGVIQNAAGQTVAKVTDDGKLLDAGGQAMSGSGLNNFASMLSAPATASTTPSSTSVAPAAPVASPSVGSSSSSSSSFPTLTGSTSFAGDAGRLSLTSQGLSARLTNYNTGNGLISADAQGNAKISNVSLGDGAILRADSSGNFGIKNIGIGDNGSTLGISSTGISANIKDMNVGNNGALSVGQDRLSVRGYQVGDNTNLGFDTKGNYNIGATNLLGNGSSLRLTSQGVQMNVKDFKVADLGDGNSVSVGTNGVKTDLKSVNLANYGNSSFSVGTDGKVKLDVKTTNLNGLGIGTDSKGNIAANLNNVKLGGLGSLSANSNGKYSGTVNASAIGAGSTILVKNGQINANLKNVAGTGLSISSGDIKAIKKLFSSRGGSSYSGPSPKYKQSNLYIAIKDPNYYGGNNNQGLNKTINKLARAVKDGQTISAALSKPSLSGLKDAAKAAKDIGSMLPSGSSGSQQGDNSTPTQTASNTTPPTP